MKSRQQPTADSRQPKPFRGGLLPATDPRRVSGRNAVSCELSAVSRVSGSSWLLGRRLAWLLALSTLTPSVAVGQYLAVFEDGRILPVTGARLVGEVHIHLDLPGGGSLEVPLSRVDRVIEDVVEPEPEPIEEPPCSPAFEALRLPEGTPFAKEIFDASRTADLHPRLVEAVVQAESAFNPFAVSRVGAGGLMQLMPSVWLPQGVTNPYDPKTNLRLGCRHLKALLDRFGDLSLALAAYNAGVATVEKSGGVPPYRETREFVRRVLARFCPAQGQRGGRS